MKKSSKKMFCVCYKNSNSTTDEFRRVHVSGATVSDAIDGNNSFVSRKNPEKGIKEIAFAVPVFKKDVNKTANYVVVYKKAGEELYHEVSGTYADWKAAVDAVRLTAKEQKFVIADIHFGKLCHGKPGRPKKQNDGNQESK